MNYQVLIDGVKAVIKQNGNEEITGDLLQQTLLAMISAFGVGYQFVGVATPDTLPGTPDARVCYLCVGAGNYANFGPQFVLDGTNIAICRFDTAWTNVLIDIPTKSSVVLIRDLASETGDSEVLAMSQKAITDALATKVDKVEGKGLSANDFTDELKAIVEAALTTDNIVSELGESDTNVLSQAAITSILSGYAKISGLYQQMIVGSAQGVLATSAVEAFFLFQQSGATGNGAALIPTIKGRTRAWNQLIAAITTASVINDVSFTPQADGSIIVNGTAPVDANAFLQTSWKAVVANHKYLVRGCPAGGSTKTYSVYEGGNGRFTETGSGFIYTPASNVNILPGIMVRAGASVPNLRFYIQFFDLTLLYGSEISGMTDEQILAKFQAEYPEPYYPYNSGALRSNDAAALLTDGRNQWDEQWRNDGYYGSNGIWTYSAGLYFSSKNMIPIFGGIAYYFKFPRYGYLYFYDAAGNFISKVDTSSYTFTYTTPANAAYMHFSLYIGSSATYNNDICINISDPSFNGTYQPYWQRVLALRLSELTGIPEGGTEADRVTMFPNGLGGVGSAFDSIFVENGVTKARGTMMRLDLGTPTWIKGTYAFFTTLQEVFRPNLICAKYVAYDTEMSGSAIDDKTIAKGSGNAIYIRDTAYTDAATFKAAMSGVYLECELATPIVYTDLQYADGTPFIMPQMFRTAQGGTMLIISPEGATAPSAPFSADIVYPVDPIASSGASLKNLLEALKTATVITSYTMTFNSTTQQYEFTITK